MKKIIVMAFAAFALASCNDTKEETKESSTSTTKTYTAAEGDVKYAGSKVMVYRNGAWVEADSDVKLDNGVTVYRDGRVERDDWEIRLREGEVVNKTGEFFDDAGNAISNAWEATKEGAKDAGRAIKKGANKVGDKIEDALDGDSTKK